MRSRAAGKVHAFVPTRNMVTARAAVNVARENLRDNAMHNPIKARRNGTARKWACRSPWRKVKKG